MPDIHLIRSHALGRDGARRAADDVAARLHADFGVDADQFLAAMQSFGVNVKVRRAAEHMQRIKIPETPSIVVNGRYLVRGDTVDDMLRIAAALIEQERARSAGR